MTQNAIAGITLVLLGNVMYWSSGRSFLHRASVADIESDGTNGGKVKGFSMWAFVPPASRCRARVQTKLRWTTYVYEGQSAASFRF